MIGSQLKNANPGLAIRRARNGLGVFALSDIKSGAVITIIAGKRIHWRKLLRLPSKILNNAFRYGSETYLMPAGFGEFFNHSCCPNAGLQKSSGKLMLVATRDIKKSEEVTFDYSTQIGADDIWRMNCKCGEKDCRKIIKSFTSIPKVKLCLYIEKGIIPKYVLDTAKQHRP